MPISFTCPHCGVQTDVADQFAGQSGPCAQCGKPIAIPPLPADADMGPVYAPQPQRSSSTGLLAVILVLLGFFVCGGILVSPLLPTFFSPRQPARRMACANNLKQIGLALLSYEATHGSFPPAYVADEEGKPLYSWRVLILPDLGQESLYDAFHLDEPWDSPHNREIAETPLRIFECPSANHGNPWETNYVMVVGPDAIAHGTQATRMDEISDGLSNTILVVETVESGIGWAEPRDLDVADLNLAINDASGRGIGSHHSSGANVVFCDALVRFLPDSLDPETLRRLLNRHDGEPVDVTSF